MHIRAGQKLTLLGLLVCVGFCCAAAEPLPLHYTDEPFNTSALGNSACSFLGYFRQNGGARVYEEYVGPGGRFFMDFAAPFTNGPGADFALLTGTNAWIPAFGPNPVRLEFFANADLQGSFDTSLVADQLFEFELPPQVNYVTRVVLTSLATADSDITLDLAGAAYTIVPEPEVSWLVAWGVTGVVLRYAGLGRRRLVPESLSKCSIAVTSRSRLCA